MARKNREKGEDDEDEKPPVISPRQASTLIKQTIRILRTMRRKGVDVLERLMELEMELGAWFLLAVKIHGCLDRYDYRDGQCEAVRDLLCVMSYTCYGLDVIDEMTELRLLPEIQVARVLAAAIPPLVTESFEGSIMLPDRSLENALTVVD